jgi:hypothetical protein
MASPAQPQEERQKSGGQRNLLPFAAVALNLLALFNGLDAMAAITDSRVVTATDRYVFGDLHSSGWALLFLAAAQGLAGVGLMFGITWARWVATVVLCLNIFTQFAFMPTYPAWSVVIIAVDVVALYAVLTSPYSVVKEPSTPSPAQRAEEAWLPQVPGAEEERR